MCFGFVRNKNILESFPINFSSIRSQTLGDGRDFPIQLPYLAEEETEAERDSVTCLRIHSGYMAELDINPLLDPLSVPI